MKWLDNIMCNWIKKKYPKKEFPNRVFFQGGGTGKETKKELKAYKSYIMGLAQKAKEESEYEENRIKMWDKYCCK